MRTINGSFGHDCLVKKTPRKLRYQEGCDFDEWKAQVREKFEELVGIANIQRNACAENYCVEQQEEFETYTKIRFVFESEKDEFVPCYLLIPKTGKETYPVAITLQGHSTGFHNSIGEIKFKQDVSYQPRGALALQAVENGFAALAIEQREMGERRSVWADGLSAHKCSYDSMRALHLGRTIIGERLWDISRAIDILPHFKNLDMDNIVITGNSGGGTASYYALCYDERIKAAAPSCALCTFEDSILSVLHCTCNYIPNIGEWFEMQDLACLAAPRKLSVIAGKEDDIFPLSGVKKCFNDIQEIYQAANAMENTRLVVTPKAHWWCEDIVWEEICKMMK